MCILETLQVWQCTYLQEKLDELSGWCHMTAATVLNILLQAVSFSGQADCIKYWQLMFY